jgi:hypothetical protein
MFYMKFMKVCSRNNAKLNNMVSYDVTNNVFPFYSGKIASGKIARKNGSMNTCAVD